MSRAATLARRWWWQRASAVVLALCVVVHLGVVIYAVRGGLTAGEIRGRLHENWAFGAFYVVFVGACAIHAPIGIVNVLTELRGGESRLIGGVALVFAVLVLALGLRAVYAVVIR